MKTRAMQNGNVVWFGSAGLKNDGTKIAANNFSEKQQHVADSLRQKLSIFKGELWYNVKFGIPLFDKIKSKAIIDANVLDVITSQADVKEVLSFTSQVLNRKYTCKAEILTVFGQISISV